ncbi:MAG: TVP38/TMEM64 family protein [Planctomycetota bacterium]|nr:MAG: TVP38/TMEM64 family protein [Planctomycetota bacterium]REJ94587.1 MAG: TVP38/TMEM64 family protein [Planctomycetota bacterium]REK24528.1 MAG: TVP38/TMEM64 family protein [Planctomycetota bacterium]REK38333.1 MAG: TVP38/TMEM64 family protein [Planctomycetota bacterium]
MRALPIEQLRDRLQQWITGLGPVGVFVFVLIYIVATVCLLPASVLTLLGGAVFGLATGFIAVSFASTTGAAAAFLIARYLAREKVEQMARGNPKFAAIDSAISEGGWKIVALLRLSPAVPFNIQNYLYGLTAIRFGPYVLTSWLAMIPGTFLYVYLGHIAGAAAAGGRERTTGEWVLLGVGLIATIAVTLYITRLARKKLRETSSRIAESGEKTDDPSQPSSPALFVVAALLMLALAAVAHLQRDAVAEYLTTCSQGSSVGSDFHTHHS